MRKTLAVLVCLSAIFAFVPKGTAQSMTGVFPYSTRGAGGIDLATTHIFIPIPMRSKTGIIPFNFNAYLDSYPAGGAPNEPGGAGAPDTRNFFIVTLAGSGGLSFTETGNGFSCGNGNTSDKFSNFTFTDSTGAVHLLSVGSLYQGGGAGTGGCVNSVSPSSLAFDGSGYTLVSTGNIQTLKVYDRHGNRVDKGIGDLILDLDGNSISFSGTTNGGTSFLGTSNNFTDTLSQLALSHTTNGTFIVDTYTYTDSSNQPQTYTITQTPGSWDEQAFGCNQLPNQPVAYPTTISTPVGSYTFSYEPSPRGGGATTGRISTVTYPSGASISYSYSGVNTACTVIPKTVVTINDNNGHNYQYTYVNNNASKLPIPPNAINYTVVATDPGNNQTVYTFADTLVTQVQAYQGGCPTSVNGCTGGGTLLSTQLTCYNGNTSNCASLSASPVPITQVDVFTTPAGMSTSNHVRKVFDSYGNITQTVLYDFGATTPTTTIDTPIGTWNGSACVAIGNNINDRLCYKNVFNGSDSGGTLLSSETFSYDSKGHLQTHVTATSSAGISGPTLTQSYAYNSNGTVATATDVNGTITQVNYNGTITQVNYNGTGGCNSILPTSNVVAGLTTSQQWDCNGGVVTQTGDANSQPTIYAYNDPLWRVTQVTDPTGAVTTTCYGLNSGGTCSPNTKQIETVLNFNSGASTVDQLKTSDGLGRTIFDQKRQAPGSASFDSTAYTYAFNTIGAVQTTSMPYSGAAAAVPPTGTPLTTTQYDALGRVISVMDGGGGQRLSSYSKNDVLQTLSPAPTGENTKKKQLEYDGLGRLTSVCEILSSGGSSCGQNTTASGYKTSYAYSVSVAGGSQMAVTQGAQTRTYVYDGLARLISETNPESGTTTYAYDSSGADVCSATTRSSPGDLLRRTDANSNYVCYIYDSLHRVTDVGNNLESAGGPCRRFRYDNSNGVTGSRPTGVTVSNTLGRLVEAETDTCASPITQASILTDEWSSYSARGENTDLYESTPNSGGYYHTTAQYWADGALQTLGGVPSYGTMNYGVDGEGRPSSAQQGTSKIVCDSSCSNASTIFYPDGQPHVVNIGGTTDNDTYTYYANTGLMNTYTYTVGSTPASISGTLTWNTNGTLRSLVTTDGFNAGGAQTCNFGTSSVAGYDDLGRLLTANCGSVWSQTFSYDQYGNITKTGSLSWACSTCYNNNNQYNSTLSASISYDAAGNLLNDTFHKYTWDAYGHPLTIGGVTGTVTCGTNGTCLTYDANGRMVEKNVSGTFTQILYSPVGKTATMSGQTTTNANFPLPAGEGLFETGTTGSNHFFWHKDWLGTVRFQSNMATRVSAYDRAFAPFGEMYNNFGTTTQLNFTGDTQDTIAGMFDTPNRELHPNQGRWIAPDLGGLSAVDMSNPQTWNRYAYVGNNPLGLTDPAGTNPDKEIIRTHPCMDDGYGMKTCYPAPDPGWDEFDIMNIPVVGGSEFGLLASLHTTASIMAVPDVASIDDAGNVTYSPDSLFGDDFALSHYNFYGWYSPVIGMGADIINSQGPANNGPDPVAVQKSMQNFVIGTIKQALKDAITQGFCGSSPTDAVLKSMKFGAARGVATGAWGGAGAAGVETFGFGAVPGAILGGTLGGIAGAGGGALWGGARAGVCSLSGAYGSGG